MESALRIITASARCKDIYRAYLTDMVGLGERLVARGARWTATTPPSTWDGGGAYRSNILFLLISAADGDADGEEPLAVEVEGQLLQLELDRAGLDPLGLVDVVVDAEDEGGERDVADVVAFLKKY